jgi:hypothetical protein
VLKVKEEESEGIKRSSGPLLPQGYLSSSNFFSSHDLMNFKFSIVLGMKLA